MSSLRTTPEDDPNTSVLPLSSASTNNNNNDNNDDDDGGENDVRPCLCTFPVTGTNPAMQAIYVCLDCCPGPEETASGTAPEEHDETLAAAETLVCVCEACAEVCHAGHDIEFVAVGPCYCDCANLMQAQEQPICILKNVSRAKARQLGIPEEGLQLQHNSGSVGEVLSGDDDETGYLQNVYFIKELENQEVCRRLVEQAKTLVEFTRDTHWVHGDAVLNDSYEWCELEALAWSIYTRHAQAYKLGKPNTEDASGEGGAEWWVQVKQTTSPEADNRTMLASKEAVDLHYDKDETLAEVFGLGSFPALSTVTYLTASHTAAPTVIFPRTYHTPDEDVIPEMVVSRPRRGKHCVFDGRLLHGAPADPCLRPVKWVENDENGDNGQLRVTFLVNVWINKRPSGVTPLSKDIRMQLVSMSLIEQRRHPLQHLSFQRRAILSMDLTKEEDLLESTRGRIQLPFVSKGATWVDDDHDDGLNLVLVTFPPPTSNSDTVRVRFGPGLQAYLEYADTHNRPVKEVVETQEYYI